jgi:hypothetical protein
MAISKTQSAHFDQNLRLHRSLQMLIKVLKFLQSIFNGQSSDSHLRDLQLFANAVEPLAPVPMVHSAAREFDEEAALLQRLREVLNAKF